LKYFQVGFRIVSFKFGAAFGAFFVLSDTNASVPAQNSRSTFVELQYAMASPVFVEKRITREG